MPTPLRFKVLLEIHVNHTGIVRMKNLACSLWYPSLDQNIEQVANFCRNCHVNQNMPSNTLMHPWRNAKSPWIRTHLGSKGLYLKNCFLFSWIYVQNDLMFFQF